MIDIDRFEICAHPREYNPQVHDLLEPRYRVQLNQLVNQRVSIREGYRTPDRHRAHTNRQLMSMHLLPVCMAGVYVELNIHDAYNIHIDDMLGRIREFLQEPRTQATFVPDETFDWVRVTLIKDSILRDHKDALDREIQYNRVFSAACTSSTTHICRVYVSENQHQIVVVTNIVSNLMMQRLIAALPAMAPWIPAKSEDFPIAMYQALGKNDAREYYTAFTKWQTKVVNAYFQEQAKIQRVEYVKALFRVDLNSLERSIAQHTQRIQTIENDLYSKYAQLRELQIKKEGLTKLSENTSPDIDYFLKHRRITFIDALTGYTHPGTCIRFGISTPCINYDKALLSSFINSTRRNDYNDTALQRKMYTELFLKDRYVLWLHYNIVWKRSSADSDWALSTDSAACMYQEEGQNDIGLWNPHLFYYQCYGQNASYINKALAQQDYIMALEQSIACVGTLNFADGIVMTRLHSNLMRGTNTTCIQDTETGEFITLQQFKERISES